MSPRLLVLIGSIGYWYLLVFIFPLRISAQAAPGCANNADISCSAPGECSFACPDPSVGVICPVNIEHVICCESVTACRDTGREPLTPTATPLSGAAAITSCQAPNKCQDSTLACAGGYTKTADCAAKSTGLDLQCCQIYPTPIPTLNPVAWRDVPCGSTTDPEFHPLRPYPGSPCDRQLPKDNYLAFACGQNANLGAKVKIINGEGVSCGNGDKCVDKRLDFDLTMDFSQTSIPVLSNTEDPNLSDADKVNAYLAWYLNGTVQQSEQTPITSAEIDRLVNYSGPVKKLLPFDAQQNLRRTVITSDQLKRDYHNYIVGCQRDPSFEHIQKSIQTLQAYTQVVYSSIGTIFHNTRELSDFATTLASLMITNEAARTELLTALSSSPPDWPVLLKFASELYTPLRRIYEANRDLYYGLLITLDNITLNHAKACSQVSEIAKTTYALKRLSDFNPDHLPPDPANYTDYLKYQKDYNKWLDRIQIPLVGGVLDTVFGRPQLDAGLWAQLFQNVPFSSLEDTVGQVILDLGSVESNKRNAALRITRQSGHRGADSYVYIPGVRNINALAEIITRLGRPKEAGALETKDNSGLVSQDLSIGSDSTAEFDSAQCELSQVQFHPPGDKVLGGQISAHLTYTQTFRYQPIASNLLPGGAVCTRDDQCQSDRCELDLVEDERGRFARQSTCAAPEPLRQETVGQIKVITKIPLVNQIYDTLVAGPQSLLRRFLPQTELIKTGSEALPAASEVSYQLDSAAADGSGNNLSGAGVTAGDGSGGPQIYWAKLGSLFSYILGAGSSENFNLQRLLRPAELSAPTSSQGGSCSVSTSDYCTPERLSLYFPGHETEASQICQKESGGYPLAKNTSCLSTGSDHTADYSVGLFQANLICVSNHGLMFDNRGRIPDCHTAFSNFRAICDGQYELVCNIINQPLVDRCVAWFQNPTNALKYAQLQSSNGTNWSPWSAARACRIIP